MTEDWLKRWQEGRTGFHRESVHPALMKYWTSLGVARGARVLVPLCGKSRDMRWLAEQIHPVLGIELAEIAIEQFLSEGVGEVSRYRHANFDISCQDCVELWCGDFFHFHADQSEEIGAFYDRAALIALPEASRQRYAFHLAQLLPPDARGLLITLTRAPGDRGGPPFEVTADEVSELFSPNFEITHLEDNVPDPDSGFQESIWQLKRRGPAAG